MLDGARLRAITIDELAVRGRQELRKRLERTAGRSTIRRPKADATSTLATDRFFPGATSADVRRLVPAHTPAASSATIECADQVCSGRFSVLGHGIVSFGNPVDWHLDPISGVRAPLVHWSQLDVLDRNQVGDSKVPWELNRQQWLVELGQAYRLTGEDRYRDAFVELVRSWRECNPPGVGINWASSLEVALRLIAWIWALYLFADAPRMPDDFVPELTAAAAEHAAHVERYLSYYYAPNTHLTGEALGLLYAGLLLRGDRRAERWQDRGMRILTEQCPRQIAPDGAYFEQSTQYGRYTAEIYLHAMILAQRNGLAFPSPVKERVGGLLDQLLWLRAPRGSMPMIGDADGGWLLPLARRAPDDLRGVFSTAAAWFGRSEYWHAAGGVIAPETLWLLGLPAVEATGALGRSAPPEPPSRVFPDGGIVVMRDSWQADAHQMIFDVGPLAKFGHGHADLLSVQCAVFGEPCIVDPGTYCYAADPGLRDYFRSTAAHSTVTIDGIGQSTPARLFSWTATPTGRLVAWRSGSEFDYAEAEHDAYRSLTDPVVHRRRVLFVKSRYWLIVDDFDGASSHRVDLRFQFAALELGLEPSGWARARLGGDRGLLLRSLSVPEPLTAIHVGREDLPAGWISRDYGHREPAPALVHSWEARLPLRVATLLWPFSDGLAACPATSASFDDRGALRALSLDDTGERIEIDDQLVRPVR